jgi:short-subunit dehydrogenase
LASGIRLAGAEVSGAPVSLTTIHPGGIKTNIAKNARFDDSVAELAGGDSEKARRDFDELFVTSPEKAARQILTAVQRDRRRALIGPHQGVPLRLAVASRVRPAPR